MSFCALKLSPHFFEYFQHKPLPEMVERAPVAAEQDSLETAEGHVATEGKDGDSLILESVESKKDGVCG